ncbi:CAAX protease self-immunity [Candidatus Norongarragalina meridionalis]|nr:CAAX protease self-immunity [Candidatus Norongarragalina meridionalis]
MGLESALLVVSATLAAPFLLLRFEGKRNWRKELFLDKKTDWVLTGLRALKLLGAIFLGMLLVGYCLEALGFLDTHKIADIIRGSGLPMLLLTITLVPIAEELLFRAYLQPRVGVLFTSLLFAGLHYGYGSVAEIVAAFTASILLGLEMRKNKDVRACILAHAMYNLSSIILVTSGLA